jgi:predicted nucleotidyltransferase
MDEFSLSFNNSSSTLLKEENSTLDDVEDDMSQETALNHISNFHTRKLISRKVRYQKSHLQRAATLSKLNSLYEDISHKTARPKVEVEESLMIMHSSDTLSEVA